MSERSPLSHQKTAEQAPMNEQKLIELFRRMRAGRLPEHPDLIYLFSHTKENQDSVLDLAPELSAMDAPFAIAGTDGTESTGYPGFSPWKESLEARGIPDDRIIPMPGAFSSDPTDGKLKGNTLTESQAIVRYAKERGMKDLIVAATQWHLPRAFMTTVTAALKEYPALRVYPKIGRELPWFQESTGSQGAPAHDRLALMAQEMERIVKYHEKGDLASPEEVLAYMDARDAAAGSKTK